MPWTLYRYILRELLKVLVLTTAVMVVVLSFGAAVGPMTDGMLGPGTLIKFVLYTMPTVLGFALPFAGAFSATVVFHTMTKDNEVLACRAGGMSYSRIFAPVAALGLVLMLLLLLLSNTVVPGFWKAAKKTVEGDVLGVLVSQLNQNRPYMLGDDLVLYTDSADEREPPAGSSLGDLKAVQFIVMTGVALGQIDNQSGRVVNDTTASSASALLVRDESGKSYISLRLQDPVIYDAQSDESQTFGRSGSFGTNQPIPLPDPISDEATFYTFRDLMRLKHDPNRFDRVREAKDDLAAAISRQQLTNLITQSLDPDEGLGFIALKGGFSGTYYRLSAPVVETSDRGLVLRASGEVKVTVDSFDNAELRGDPDLRFEGGVAELIVNTDRFDREAQARITMQNVRVLRFNDSGAVTNNNNKAEYAFPAMRYTEQVLGQDPASMTVEQLSDWTQQDAMGKAAGVQAARRNLLFRIYELEYMIDAELYKRFATAIATPLLLLLGTLLAVRLHDRLPLVVFFWAFILAILTLVMIYTGSSMAERVEKIDVLTGSGGDRLIGVAVLWGGNLILLLLIGRLYLRVARN